jgi:membrane fusion protein (multidrug efflux system)
MKRVSVDGLHGAQWIVTDGLSDGDRMILSGTQNARPGASVVPVPYQGQPAASADAAAAAVPGK